MKLSKGASEQGVVVGNTYDKYNLNNPILRWVMQGFESDLLNLVNMANPSEIHEVGCGEGYWTLRWLAQGLNVRGSDFSEKVLTLARENARDRNLPSDVFTARSIYDLQASEDSAELIVCCEVLEHLEQPREALSALQKVTTQSIVLSVPREPIWSILNMARGKYWRDLGNTPGHIQRWSKHDFVELASEYFEVQQIRNPLPWTMLLCSRKRMT